MSSIDDTQAAIDALDAPAAEPDAPEVESGADTGTETEGEHLYAGKYKSAEELEKGYTEAQREYTQTRQEIAELRAQLEQASQPAEEAFDPWSQLGSGLDEATAQQIYQQIYHNPAGMMEWAVQPETQRQFGPQIADQVYATWYGLQPFQAQQYVSRMEAARTIEQPREELQRIQQEWFAERHKSESGDALRWSAENLPDFEKYKPAILDLYTKYTQGDDDPRIQGFESIKTYLEQLYAEARWREFKQQGVVDVATQAATPNGQKAKTQTRSSAAAQNQYPEDVQSMMDEILAGQPGRDQ